MVLRLVLRLVLLRCGGLKSVTAVTLSTWSLSKPAFECMMSEMSAVRVRRRAGIEDADDGGGRRRRDRATLWPRDAATRGIFIYFLL